MWIGFLGSGFVDGNDANASAFTFLKREFLFDSLPQFAKVGCCFVFDCHNAFSSLETFTGQALSFGSHRSNLVPSVDESRQGEREGVSFPEKKMKIILARIRFQEVFSSRNPSKSIPPQAKLMNTQAFNPHDITIENAKHELKVAGEKLEARFELERRWMEGEKNCVVAFYCGEERDVFESQVNVCRLKLEMAMLAKKLAEAEEKHTANTTQLFRSIAQYEKQKQEDAEANAFINS
jgi:hypothetical protein